jgi:5'-nucleotidase
MKRREFITKTAAGSALVLGGMALQSFDNPETTTITILHTNDVHSHIDPFPADDPKYGNLGGAARRATLIEQVRHEQGADGVLLLDAGDVFQGTPYFNYYGGELEMRLMSMMKYDIGTMGNHDFDNSIDGFLKQLPHATFPFVSANYDFKRTVLNGIVEPYKIFERRGIKIGIFGLGIELNGLVDKKLYKETVYLNPIEIAQDMSRILKIEKKCDIVICLSHLGFIYPNENQKISDIVLARTTKNIDLIVGGHTHTFLTKPYLEKNLDGEEVMINQVGCYGLNVGRIDFTFEYGKKSGKGRLMKVE